MYIEIFGIIITTNKEVVRVDLHEAEKRVVCLESKLYPQKEITEEKNYGKLGLLIEKREIEKQDHSQQDSEKTNKEQEQETEEENLYKKFLTLGSSDEEPFDEQKHIDTLGGWSSNAELFSRDMVQKIPEPIFKPGEPLKINSDARFKL